MSETRDNCAKNMNLNLWWALYMDEGFGCLFCCRGLNMGPCITHFTIEFSSLFFPSLRLFLPLTLPPSLSSPLFIFLNRVLPCCSGRLWTGTPPALSSWAAGLLSSASRHTYFLTPKALQMPSSFYWFPSLIPTKRLACRGKAWNHPSVDLSAYNDALYKLILDISWMSKWVNDYSVKNVKVAGTIWLFQGSDPLHLNIAVEWKP